MASIIRVGGHLSSRRFEAADGFFVVLSVVLYRLASEPN